MLFNILRLGFLKLTNNNVKKIIANIFEFSLRNKT